MVHGDLYKSLLRNLQEQGCGATRNHLAFDVHGKMQPCHRFLGNAEFELKEQDILDRDKSNLISAIVAYGDTKDCNKCWARGLCGGQCFHVGRGIARRDDHESKQLQMCRFKRKQYQLAIEAYIEICKKNTNLMS